MRVFNYIKKNKKDLINIFILLIIFITLAIMTWGHLGDALIDAGREPYFAEQILKGHVLYKDIFNIFAPLSYQINALLFMIFGISLNVLYMAGSINAFLIVALTYFISRTLTSKNNSLFISLSVVFLCVFHYFIFNYIAPYTYAIVYALSAFLASVLCGIHYIKSNKENFLLASVSFFVLSALFKYDYLMAAPIILALFFYKPVPKKSIWKFLTIPFIAPAISFGTLFLQGLTFTDIINYLNDFKHFTHAPSYLHFLNNNTGFYLSTKNIITDLGVMITFAQKSIALIILYFVGIYIHNKRQKNGFSISAGIISVIGIFLFLKTFFAIPFSHDLFCWIGIICFFIAIYFLTSKYISFIEGQNLTEKDKIFLFTMGCAILSSLKTLWYIDLLLYGIFFVPLLAITFFTFIFEYALKSNKFINAELLKKSIIIFTCFLFLQAQIVNIKMIKLSGEIKTNRGTTCSQTTRIRTIVETIKYINQNTKSNESILIVPEGVMINFLTGRDSNNTYYALIPNHIEAFGENRIIGDLKKNPPDYIFINNRTSYEYGKNCFGQDYGLKIFKYITDNYQYKKTIGDSFQMRVYKFRNQKR